MASVLEALRIAAEQREQGRPDVAGEVCRRILAADSGNVDALNLLGLLASDAGDHAAAVDLFRRAIAGLPDAGDFHFHLAVALQAVGDVEASESSLRQALTHDPTLSAARNALGVSLRHRGRMAEAEAELRLAVEADPDDAAVLANLANVIQERGRFDAALIFYRRSLAASPTPEAHAGLGNTLLKLNRPAEAEAAFDAALAMAPDDADVLNGLGLTLKALARYDEALSRFHDAIRARPEHARTWANMATVLQALGRVDEMVDANERAAALDPGFLRGRSNYLVALNYDPRFAPDDVVEKHRDWGRLAAIRAASRALPPPPQPTPATDRPLRIGYLSGDFCRHPGARFIESLLSARDRADFHVTCYAEVPRPDDISRRMMALADAWRPTVGLDDCSVAEAIRDDGIDILVDLNGHFGSGRLSVMAWRPAPVQCSYMGYPNTTGLDAVDVKITDAWADPPGLTERYHAERLLRLPGGFLCFRPDDASPDVAPPPHVRHGYITFGSFNNAIKTGPQVIALWSRILREIEDARLFLKAGQFADPAIRQRFADAFAAHGIAPARLRLQSYVADPVEHLADYGDVDTALDTFPYNGTTTTCEALWMGVPVIGLAGDRTAARVGVSILNQIGLPELIADDADDYVAKAVALARDSDRIVELRTGMRYRIAGCTLGDAKAFMSGMEVAYRQIWAEAVARSRAHSA